MNANKQKIFKNILLLNLIVGIHNIINFTLNGYLTAFIIGCANIGVWVMLRNVKNIPIIIKKTKKY